MDAKVRLLNLQIGKQCGGDLFQQTPVDFPRALAAGDGDIHS
jgi:hypothetical protein